MSSNPVKFHLGGVQRQCRVELGLAPKLEAATGYGIIALAKSLRDFTATTSTVVEVLREAMLYNGQTFKTADVFKMLETEGLIAGYKAAMQIIDELFSSPPSKKKAPVQDAN